MFNLTYTELNNSLFMGGLKHLSQESLPMPVSYNLLKIINAVEAEMKVASSLYQNILMSHAELDAQGKLVFKDGVQGQFIIPEDKRETFNEKMNEWHKISFKIERNQLSMNMLTKSTISTQMLSAVMPVIEDDIGPAESEEATPVETA